MRPLSFFFFMAAVVTVIVGCGDGAARQRAIDSARAQVKRLAAELDERTTESGVYIRVRADEIQEKDPWSTTIQVSYSQGGVAEVVRVRSAGPDREFQTDDDLVAEGMTANLKGVGEGIKKNTEDVAAKAAKGFIKGAVEGVRESVKDALPSKKSEDEKGPTE